MLSLLTECSVLMLKVICDMYWKQKITYDEFLRHTEVKIQFLLENMNNIASEADRVMTCDIINKYTSIISQSNSPTMLNVFCCNTDIIQ